MKRVKKWVYYCEFCKKSGRSASHMAQHEKHCTANPDRECGMCEVIGNQQTDYRAVAVTLRDKYDIDQVTQKIKDEIEQDGVSATWDTISYGTDHGTDHGFNLPTADDIGALVPDDCPACILTILRMLDICALVKFSWAERKKDWQDGYNESQY